MSEDVGAQASEEEFSHEIGARDLIYRGVEYDDVEIVDDYLNTLISLGFALGSGQMQSVVETADKDDLDAVKAGVLVGLDHTQGAHTPSFSDFGDGVDYPREEWVRCSCGQSLLTWQQSDEQCSGRPMTDEYFDAYQDHLRAVRTTDNDLKSQLRQVLDGASSDAQKLAILGEMLR